MQLDLGAIVTAPDPSRAAMSFHTLHDGSPHAESIAGHVFDVEARTAVPHERLDAVGADLDICRDRRPTVSNGIEQGLSEGRDQGLPMRLERPIPGDDQIDGNAMQVLDLVCRRGHGRTEGAPLTRGHGIQPGAKFPLLRAREPGYGGRVAGLSLDQCQGLQYRVV